MLDDDSLGGETCSIAELTCVGLRCIYCYVACPLYGNGTTQNKFHFLCSRIVGANFLIYASGYFCFELFLSFSYLISSVKLLVAVVLVLNGASFLFSGRFYKSAFHVSLYFNTRSSY